MSSGRYDDILYLNRPESRHPRMSRENRAAQFAPFAALTGYEACIEEEGRLTERRRDREEDSRALLDEKLRILRNRISEKPEIEVTWFCPDTRKAGGSYRTACARALKLDAYHAVCLLEDGSEIPVREIFDMKGEIFHGLEDDFA